MYVPAAHPAPEEARQLLVKYFVVQYLGSCNVNGAGRDPFSLPEYAQDDVFHEQVWRVAAVSRESKSDARVALALQ